MSYRLEEKDLHPESMKNSQNVVKKKKNEVIKMSKSVMIPFNSLKQEHLYQMPLIPGV